MSKLSSYKNLKEKSEAFENKSYTIDSIADLRKWYDRFNDEEAKKCRRFFFRGVGEAKFKNYTSAQRLWVSSEVSQWSSEPTTYLDMLENMLDYLRSNLLFEKVFDYYKVSDEERDFPLLSILQHYGAPTPLLDWTYNIDVALYISTEHLSEPVEESDMDNYFSIYVIDKLHAAENKFMSFKSFTNDRFLKINHFKTTSSAEDQLLYLSDFEDEELPENHPARGRPLTTYYNLNILPQEGLFLFNPSPDLCLEEFIVSKKISIRKNSESPFFCLNIRKDLGEYARRLIGKARVNNGFIYPVLKDTVSDAVNIYLNKLVT